MLRSKLMGSAPSGIVAFNLSLNFYTGVYSYGGTTYSLSTMPGLSYSNQSSTYAGQSVNQLLYSTDLTNAVWSKIGTTSTGGQSDAFGGTSAALIAEDGSNGLHLFRQGTINLPTSNSTVTYSTYIKAGTRRYVNFVIMTSSGYAWIIIDTVGWAIVNSNAAFGPTIISSGLTSAGGGWYRVYITASLTSNSVYFEFSGATSSTDAQEPTYTGSSSWYLCGTQLEVSSTMNNYLPTTSSVPSPLVAFSPSVPRVTNLGLLVEGTASNQTIYSQLLSNSAWSQINMAATISGTAPDGTSTANLISEQVNNSSHLYYPATNYTVSSAQVVTLSSYFKAGTRNLVQLAVINGSNYFYLTFNMSTGAITETLASGSGTYLSSTVLNCGNGWYRVSLTGYISGQTSYGIYIAGTTTATGGGLAPTYLGDSSKNFSLWGVQFETGPTPTSYIANTSVNLLPHSDPTPWDVSTNPIGWTNFNPSIPVVTTTSQTDPAQGTKGVLLAIPASAQGNSFWGTQSNITTSVGQSYTASVWLKTQSGTATISLGWGIYGVTGPNIGSDIVVTSTWNRYTITFTATVSNTVTFVGITTGSAGAAANVIAAFAQIEQGLVATNYMPTTTTPSSVSVRFADAVTQTYTGSPTKVTVNTEGLGSMSYKDSRVINLLPASTTPIVYGGYNYYTYLTVNPSSVPGPDASTGTTVDLTFASGVSPGFGFWGDFYNYNIAMQPYTTYTTSVWAKTTSGTAKFAFCIFDGSVRSSPTDSTVTTTWQRFSWTWTTGASVGGQPAGFGITFSNAQTASAFTVWGPQVEVGSVPTTYTPTLRTPYSSGVTNYLPYSIANSGNGWASDYSINQITKTNIAIAPDGSGTASHFGDNYGGGGYHGTAVGADSGSTATDWAMSGYFKYCSEITYVAVSVKSGFYDPNYFQVIINVNTGELSLTGAGGNATFISASVDTLPNGWFRLKLIGSFTYAYAPTISLGLMSDSVGTSYPGSGLGWGCYLWGFQLEMGATVNGYVPTSGAIASIYPASPFTISQGPLLGQNVKSVVFT